MKNNIIYKGFYGLSVILIAFLSFGSTVSALSVGVKSDVEVKTDGVVKTSVGASTSASAKMESGDDREEEGDDSAEVKSTSSTKVRDNDGDEGDEHKSEVALVVKGLLSIADRDGGIGSDVRLVAQEQASTSEKVKADMDKANSESKVKVFLFGSDYKNLGELRSTIVTTSNHIERLKKAQSKTASASVKADLEVQIKALEDISSTTEAFIATKEGKFSLFGWLFH